MNTETIYSKSVQIIENNLEYPNLNGAYIANQLNVNRMYLHRKLKAYCNLNASELIQSVRIKKAKEILINEQQKINEVAEQVGFKDNSYFTKTFKKITGQTPSIYKKSKF